MNYDTLEKYEYNSTLKYCYGRDTMYMTLEDGDHSEEVDLFDNYEDDRCCVSKKEFERAEKAMIDAGHPNYEIVVAYGEDMYKAIPEAASNGYVGFRLEKKEDWNEDNIEKREGGYLSLGLRDIQCQDLHS